VSVDRMGTFGKENSSGKYRVVEVCDAANSADYNQSKLLQTEWCGLSVCVYVMGIITAKTAEPIEMPFGSDCPT